MARGSSAVATLSVNCYIHVTLLYFTCHPCFIHKTNEHKPMGVFCIAVRSPTWVCPTFTQPHAQPPSNVLTLWCFCQTYTFPSFRPVRWCSPRVRHTSTTTGCTAGPPHSWNDPHDTLCCLQTHCTNLCNYQWPSCATMAWEKDKLTQTRDFSSQNTKVKPTNDWVQATSSYTRMWANAQADSRPAEHRWRLLFNAAVWLTPTTRCRAVTLPRRKTL